MRKGLLFLLKLIGWFICAMLFPFAASLFVFSTVSGAVSIIFLLFLLLAVPRVLKKRLPVFFSVLITEVLMIGLLVFFYTADRRPGECSFTPDDRVVPILSYQDCSGMAVESEKRTECLSVVDNPYDLALNKDKLYVVSGRDVSALGELDPAAPGEFVVFNLGFGNIQQIAPDPAGGLAVLPMWKDRKILLLDLNEKKPVKTFDTDVSKLIGAKKFGGKVFVISELAKLYVVNLEDRSMERRDLGYRFHTLYDIEVDRRRDAVFLSDWVWGLMYRLDAETLETVERGSLGIVATGLALDEEACELFVARPLAAKIDVLDCETLDKKKSLPAGFGVHELALSRDGRKIYAVRYSAGKFRIIDRDNGDVLDEVFIGGQTRALLFDGENDRIFAATRCGIFMISL